MDAEDRALFGRGLKHATSAHTGDALDAVLAELGWAEALASDPADAVALLFEHQGSANATSSALDQVLAQALGVDAEAVVLPALGRHEAPGHNGLGTAALRSASTVAVVAGDGTSVAVVDASQLTVRPVGGLDPALGLVEVRGHALDLDLTSPASWADAVAAGQRALAHELVGVARTMLGLARDHAVERIQFGVPIASFQAVRHRLAESLVAIEIAAAAADAAWLDGSPLGAALAKAIAGRSGRTVARHSQQVLAGIGFTAEHDLHRYVRRTIALDGLLGDARTLTTALGTQLLQDRRLPPLLAL